MDLLENLVDVDAVRLLPPALLLLVALGDGLLGLAGLLGSLSGGLRWHVEQSYRFPIASHAAAPPFKGGKLQTVTIPRT